MNSKFLKSPCFAIYYFHTYFVNFRNSFTSRIMASAERNNKEDLLYKKNSKIHDDKNQTGFIETTVLQEDVDKKVVALRHLLEKDPKAADLKWSLFIAACHTYRYDTCLKPFPPMYIKNECKDIDALVFKHKVFLI